MDLEAFISFLALEKKYSTHTVQAYQKDLEAFAVFCLNTYGDEDIDHISYAIIRSWIVNLVNTGKSNRTVNRKMASLKAYYKFLMQIERITVNPLAKHKALKTPKKIEIPFSELEMEQLLNGIAFSEDFEGARDQFLIELLYATGMRRAELIHLRCADINVPGKMIKVLGKRNKERFIPLLDAAIEKYKIYLGYRKEIKVSESNDFVFLSKTGNKMYETLVYRIINRYFSKVSSKVKRSPHILRHTFATHLLNKGADLNAVKELLGHASLASTQVYTHNSISELKKAHAAAHPRSKK